MFAGPVVWKGMLYALLMFIAKAAVCSVIYADSFIEHAWRRLRVVSTQETSLKSLPHIQALILSFAMVSRGEIGFLIASLSSSSGTLTLQSRNDTIDGTASKSEELFLVITWAIVLCTLIGPLGVGITVRRLRRLESNPAILPSNNIHLTVLN